MNVIEDVDFKKMQKKKSYKKNKSKDVKHTKTEILDALKNYVEVDSKNIKTGEHVKYFVDSKNVTKDNLDPSKYRAGGFCAVNNHPTYLVLCANTKRWSVQIENCVFFCQLTKKDIIESYETAITEYEESYIKKVNKYKNKIKEIKEQKVMETEHNTANDETVTKMADEIDILRDEMKKLEEDNAEYKRNLLKIQKKYEEMYDKYRDLKDKYRDLDDEYNETYDKYHDMKDKYNKLKEKY